MLRNVTDKEIYNKFLNYLADIMLNEKLAKSYAHRVVIYCLDNNMLLTDLCSIRLFELLNLGGHINKYYRAGLVKLYEFLLETHKFQDKDISKYKIEPCTLTTPTKIILEPGKNKEALGLVSADEVCKILKISRSSFDRIQSNNTFHRIDVGGLPYYSVASINKYFDDIFREHKK